MNSKRGRLLYYSALNQTPLNPTPFFVPHYHITDRGEKTRLNYSLLNCTNPYFTKFCSYTLIKGVGIGLLNFTRLFKSRLLLTLLLHSTNCSPSSFQGEWRELLLCTSLLCYVLLNTGLFCSVFHFTSIWSRPQNRTTVQPLRLGNQPYFTAQNYSPLY